jgi:lipopolysaccharide export system permease protein
MRRLTRYVLSEVLKVFLASLVAFTLMVLIGVVVREAVDQSLPPSQILALVPYVLPLALRITIPVTLLLATTTVYARISGANEVSAIKSLGISPTVILWPTVALAFLLSLLTVWLNDLAVSWGRKGAEQVVIDSAEEIAYAMLKTRKRYNSPKFSIIVREVHGRRLIRPTVTLKRKGDVPAVTISAEEAELRSDRQSGVLRVIVRNGKIDTEALGTVRDPGIQVYEIPLRDASRAGRSDHHPSSVALREISEEVDRARTEIEQFEQELAGRAAHAMLAGDFDGLASQQWHKRHDRLDDLRSRFHRLLTEPHRRWSAGFSCLSFIWVGAPLALRLRNRDFLTSFFLCFLPILVVYYPLLMFGIDASKNGTIPPVALWSGNLLLLCWGTWLLRRVVRY